MRQKTTLAPSHNKVWNLATVLHITRYAQPGKSSVGEQRGQENFEEIEEDQPDEAVAEDQLEVM
ncbi:MAG: hypothetical protein WAN14_02560 [Candidatus Acidiferrales bacterium]